jgi:hypothetical protein
VWILQSGVDAERQHHNIYGSEHCAERWQGNSDRDFRDRLDEERSGSGHHHRSGTAAHRCVDFDDANSASHDVGFYHRSG